MMTQWFSSGWPWSISFRDGMPPCADGPPRAPVRRRRAGIQARAKTFCAVALGLSLVVGCSRDRHAGDGNVDVGGNAVSGGTAVVALSADPDVLNPLISESAVAGLVIAELYDGLTDMGEDLSFEPRIARFWEMSADSLSITYRLRPWVWSDGEPLTARDVAFSFGLFVDPRVASTRRGLYSDILAAAALDDSTVRYTLSRRLPDPVQATWHHIVPLHLLGGLDPATVADWPVNRQPLSSGEFMLEEWTHNRSLSIVRNPRYPGRPAKLDRVVFRIMEEEATRLVMLETGEVDLVDGVPPKAAVRLAGDDRIRFVATGGRRVYYLQWNCLNPIFADAETRRALSMALDRSRLISALVEGYGKPAAGPIPPALWNHDDLLSAPSCDAEASRRLLHAAGWRDDDGNGVLERGGRELRFEILTRSGDPAREQGAVILRENLAQVGAVVELRIMEHVTGLSRVRAGTFDAFFGLLVANLFGNPSPYVRSTSVDEFNHGHYANAEVDSLLDIVLGLSDREAARPLWRKLQAILAEDPPAAYLFFPDNLVGVSRRIQGVRPHLLSPINNLSEWWIAPGDRRYLAR